MLASLLLAVCPVLPCAPAGRTDATVTALGGRVELVASDARVYALAPHAPRANRGPAHLEVGIGATAEVVFAGQGSARLFGPCVVEWGPDRETLVPAMAPEPVFLRFEEFGAAEFELRNAGLAIELPSGWRLHPRRSALCVERAAGGAFRARVRAGAPCTLETPHGRAHADRAHTLVVGSTLVLAPAGRMGPRAEAAWPVPPWDDVVWPWGPRPPHAPDRPATGPLPSPPSSRPHLQGRLGPPARSGGSPERGAIVGGIEPPECIQRAP